MHACSLAASKQFTMVYVDTSLLWFILWMLCSMPLLALQCVDLDKHLYYVAIQNLVYRWSNVHLHTVGNIIKPPTHYAYHMQQFSEIITQPLEGPQSNSFQIALTEQKVSAVHVNSNLHMNICLVLIANYDGSNVWNTHWRQRNYRHLYVFMACVCIFFIDKTIFIHVPSSTCI